MAEIVVEESKEYYIKLVKTSEWEEIIKKEFENNKDLYDRIVYAYISARNIKWFEHGYGFTIWTEEYIYFMCSHDGFLACNSVPRNPREHATFI